MTHSPGFLSLVACFSLVCCHTSEPASDSTGHDASAIECSGDLTNAGFSSLATFPITSVCAADYYRDLSEYVTPCGGSILIHLGDHVKTGQGTTPQNRPTG